MSSVCMNLHCLRKNLNVITFSASEKTFAFCWGKLRLQRQRKIPLSDNSLLCLASYQGFFPRSTFSLALTLACWRLQVTIHHKAALEWFALKMKSAVQTNSNLIILLFRIIMMDTIKSHPTLFPTNYSVILRYETHYECCRFFYENIKNERSYFPVGKGESDIAIISSILLHSCNNRPPWAGQDGAGLGEVGWHKKPSGLHRAPGGHHGLWSSCTH